MFSSQQIHSYEPADLKSSHSEICTKDLLHTVHAILVSAESKVLLNRWLKVHLFHWATCFDSLDGHLK